MQAFDTSEYRTRLNKVRALMSDAGMDALLVRDEGSICYLTGYEGFSSYVPQTALVTLEEDPYLILRELDLRNNPGTVWLPEDRQIGYAEGNIGAAQRSPWTEIGEFVRGKVAVSARIGVEFSAGGFFGGELGVKDHANLVAALGGQELSDGSGLVSQCKRVKSDRELAYMMEAAVITDQAMLAGINKIAVGTRQADVAATIMAKLISGTETTPGGASHRTPWMHVGPVGGFATAPHLKWADGVYQAGQQTNLEFGASRHRYLCSLARTVYLGSPSARLREIDRGVREAWQAGFETMRPGVRCSDVARAVGAVLKRYRIGKDSRCGYSIGLEWNDGGASLATHDDTEITANMTFHLLIGIWNRDEGYNFSETVRVTNDGAKSLSSVPRQLFEIAA